MTTNNNIIKMQENISVVGLYFRPAKLVVSMRPLEYIKTREYNM